AEVQLTIENTRGVLPTAYTEVTIGRRLYRSGESEYLLNGVTCRLKDITDLFMDTGMGAGAYSVIELKMVEEILSDNAQDQRRLLEEAAGITRYKLRRRQTLGKLTSTQADLTRLNDLVDEIQRQVERLERQARKAERRQAYEAELRTLELALARAEHDALGTRLDALRTDAQQVAVQLDAQTERLAANEQRLLQTQQALDAKGAALDAAQATQQEALERVRAAEADQRLTEERVEANRREQDRLQAELAQGRDRLATLAAQATRGQQALAEAQPALDGAEATLATAQAARETTQATADAQRAALYTLRQQTQQAADARTTHRRTLDRLTSRLDLQTQHLVRARAQRRELDASVATSAERVEQAERARTEAQAARSQAQAALEHVEAEQQTLQAQLERLLNEQQQTERQWEAANAEAQILEALVHSYEALPDAVQHLATHPDWSAQPLQTVADVLSCEAAHQRALEAALGPVAACVVVATDAEAAAAQQRLRADEQGQATFVVLDRLPAEAPTALSVSATPLRTVVRTPAPAFEALADLLLHGCFLVDDLDTAEAVQAALAPSVSARLITPEGAWLETPALVHGGGSRPPSPVAARFGQRERYETVLAHREDLDAQRDRLHGAVEAQRGALDRLDLRTHRTAAQEAERAVTQAERTLTRLQVEHEGAQRRLDEVQERLDVLGQTLTQDEGQIDATQAELASADTDLQTRQAAQDAAEGTFQEAETAYRTALTHYNETHVAAVQARNRVDNLERDAARNAQEQQALRDRQDAHTALLAELGTTAETLAAQTTALSQTVATAREALSAHEHQVQERRAELRQVRQEIDAQESGLRVLRQEREATMRAEQTLAVRQAEAETRLDTLVTTIRDAYDLEVAKVEADLPADQDMAGAQARVQQLRRKIQSIGSVNALALESYEAERERLDFLLGQQRDLQEAEQTLTETIDEINTTASARFEETFVAVRHHFQRLFADLFGEDAAADLTLVDPDDPLESSLEIFARPRGKRPSTLAQLSGGEKTLTAIALLFAIYLVKPSPFCILDEVDAPLDDANVGRFMRLIRSFAGDTQFILVTHNKRTMEMADRLYGITMQEQGVSKVVSVRFDEAAAMAE
ncbi:MAG: chromosome segregation protein SMC, partial [Bacteroidota bacterium]